MAEAAKATQTATIVDHRRIPSAEPARLGQFNTMVIYELGPGQRYVVTIPADPASESQIRAAIASDIKARGQWVGKQISF